MLNFFEGLTTSFGQNLKILILFVRIFCVKKDKKRCLMIV